MCIRDSYKREVSNGMLLYPQLSGSLNSNTTQLQINNISVKIEAIDITETEITKFEKLQVTKFSNFLDTILQNQHYDKNLSVF